MENTETPMRSLRSPLIHAIAIVFGFGLLALAHWHGMERQAQRDDRPEVGGKRRYEILLPLKDNAGQIIPQEKFMQTQEELIERFGGITIIPQPVQGVWIDKGKRYEDESIRLVIDVDDNQANRAFFQQFKKRLNARFQQEDVYVIVATVQEIK